MLIQFINIWTILSNIWTNFKNNENMIFSMDFDKTLIEEHIIWKLFYQGRFGKGHFTEETMLKGLSRNSWGFAREKLKELVKKKIILYKAHDHGGSLLSK